MAYSPLYEAGISDDHPGRGNRKTWRVVVWNTRRWRAGAAMKPRPFGPAYTRQYEAAGHARDLNDRLRYRNVGRFGTARIPANTGCR